VPVATPTTTSLAQRLNGITPHEAAFLEAERKWAETARDKQIMEIDGWSLAVAMSGRGFGKTLMGASWVRRCAGLYPGVVIHVIAPTYSDLRNVAFGGESGLLSVIPAEMIEQVNHSLFEIELKNGSMIRGFSAEAPNRLRGPQCTFVWGDEVAAWGLTAEETLSNIDFSTRIVFTTKSGKQVQPQRFYTTTPRPLEWLKDMIDRPGCKVVTGSTYENRANLAEAFIKELSRYEDTQIGRQEIHGEMIDIGEAAIIKRSWIKLWPATKPLPWFEFVVISFDTALTEKTYDRETFEPDFTACTVWGIFANSEKIAERNVASWNIILLEAWRDRLGFPQLIARAKKELKAVYGQRTVAAIGTPLFGAPRAGIEQKKHPDLMIIEEKGSGISLRQQLSSEGIWTYPYNPGRADKTSRLHGVSHVAAAGRIWVPESTRSPNAPREWVKPFLDEVCVYSGPGTTKHDDYVDSASQVWRFFADRWLEAGVTTPLAEDSVTLDVGFGGITLEAEIMDVEPPYG